jgi:predicted O-linked N-acetylglucosamine transferase (SPINDLY family)
MDYLLADRWHVPEGMESHYSEKILRMPDGYVCYQPPSYAPDVSPLPAEKNGFVTFGSFNQPTKTNRDVISLWARVLKRVTGSRLLLKYRGYDDAAIRDRVLRMFAIEGIEAERIEMHGKSPHPNLLAEYQRVDIGLDTFPYSGGLTTCEALWMGVPVVTLPGATFAGRHSLSHLSNVGVTETVTSDEQEYLDCAACLAADLPRLAGIRRSLRQQMAGSPLCDAALFARNWAGQMRAIWREACANR